MKINDKVSVIDENLEGTITSVHGNVVVFKDEFGFTHQYPKEKLVLRNADFYDDIKVEKEEVSRKNSSKKNKNQPFVLDLHFEQLVDHPADYSSFERLFLQKEKLITTLEFCRKNRIKKLEIIHGIGDGVLQKMVVDVLRNQVNLEFEDHEFFYHSSASVLVNFQ